MTTADKTCLNSPGMPEWPILDESVKVVREGCPDGLACLTIDGLAEFTDWAEKATFWHSQAETRCGQKEETADDENPDT